VRRSIHSLVAGVGVSSEAGPVTFLLDLLVGNGAFHNQHKGFQLPLLGHVEVLHEVVAYFIGEDGVVQVDFGEAGDSAEQDVFNAWLGGGGDGYGVAVATKAGGDPQDVQFGDCGFLLGATTVRN
jgi:hypothetical protein